MLAAFAPWLARPARPPRTSSSPRSTCAASASEFTALVASLDLTGIDLGALPPARACPAGCGRTRAPGSIPPRPPSCGLAPPRPSRPPPATGPAQNNPHPPMPSGIAETLPRARAARPDPPARPRPKSPRAPPNRRANARPIRYDIETKLRLKPHRLPLAPPGAGRRLEHPRRRRPARPAASRRVQPPRRSARTSRARSAALRSRGNTCCRRPGRARCPCRRSAARAPSRSPARGSASPAASADARASASRDGTR